MKRDPNTAGLIYVSLGDLSTSVRSFDMARKLAPDFYEAHMNYAAVNAEFRGFINSEAAYRAALRIRPNDYDAHLGLALALRGQIDEAGSNPALMGARAELNRAQQLDPTRPEAYFNLAILTEQYLTKSSTDGAAELRNAKTLYGEFATRARGDSRFGETVKEVVAVSTKPDAQCLGAASTKDPGCQKGRIQNIDETIRFMSDTFPRSGNLAPDLTHTDEQ